MIMEIGSYVLALAVWTVYRMRFLLSERKRKEAAVYGVLMGIACMVGALVIARVNLPSFTAPAKMLFEPVGKFLLKP